MDNLFSDFTQALTREGKSALTIASYLSDLNHFATWFSQTSGEAFSPQGITLLDVRAYKSHLLTVTGLKPSTINRRLAAISRYCRWAKAQGLLANDPTREVKGVRQVKSAPKALLNLELRRLLREAHKGGKARDIAIIKTLTNTGLRVGEMAKLAIADIEISAQGDGHGAIWEGSEVPPGATEQRRTAGNRQLSSGAPAEHRDAFFPWSAR
jgi:integrase/recombinase XerC